MVPVTGLREYIKTDKELIPTAIIDSCGEWYDSCDALSEDEIIDILATEEDNTIVVAVDCHW